MKPNKLKRNLIISFSIIILLIAIIFVLYITTDIFRTKRGAFFRYFIQIPNVFDVLETSSNYQNCQKIKEEKSYLTNGEMVITDSNNIADESIMSKLKLNLSGKVDNISEKSNTDITISSENKQLFNMTVARDKNLYGFYAPKIADGYIVVRNDGINDLAEKFGILNTNNIPDELVPINIQKILELSNNEKKHLQKYLEIIKNQAPDTAYSKNNNEQIEIDGKRYQTNSYTLTLNSQQNANLQIALLEQLTKDSIMMNMITSKCKLLNLGESFTDINTLNNILKERIEELKNDSSIAGSFSMTVYEYKQKNIQTKIIIDDTEIKLSNVSDENKDFAILELQNSSNRKIIAEINKKDDGHSTKLQKQEDNITDSIEIEYNMSGTVEENNVQNHYIIKLVNDIKNITFKYDENVIFTDDIGTFKEIQDGKVAVINDYDVDYAREFIKLVKNQINSVYINEAASIGINLDPIFSIE